MPDFSRPITANDLIPLSEALARLTEWHKRKYTLADIDLFSLEGGDRITPVFYYEGKAVLYNPETVVNDDLLESYNGYIPDEVYSHYFEIWLRSQSTVVDIDGWFSLDIRHIKGIGFNQSTKLAFYLNLPQSTISSKAMVKIDRIYNDITYRSNLGYFPIDSAKHRGKELVVPINIKESPLSISLHDWYIPSKQIDRLHPDYKLIYEVDGKHYILNNSDMGLYADPMPIDIIGLDTRFYTLITNTDLMPYSMQSLANNSDIETKQTRQRINPANIGRNRIVPKNKAKVSSIAKQIWENDDPKHEIRTGDMCRIIRLIIKQELRLPNDQNLKKYFRSVTPDYASKGGANTVNKDDLINNIVAKYSQNE